MNAAVVKSGVSAGVVGNGYHCGRKWVPLWSEVVAAVVSVPLSEVGAALVGV